MTVVSIELRRLLESGRVARLGPGYAIHILQNQRDQMLREGCSECKGEGLVCGYGSCGFDGAASTEAALRLIENAPELVSAAAQTVLAYREEGPLETGTMEAISQLEAVVDVINGDAEDDHEHKPSTDRATHVEAQGSSDGGWHTWETYCDECGLRMVGSGQSAHESSDVTFYVAEPRRCDAVHDLMPGEKCPTCQFVGSPEPAEDAHLEAQVEDDRGE